MDKRGFGYDGFSDKITTHGRSHLSLLRESYQKINLKRKVTAVNLKVSFTAGFCLFFLASVFSSFCQISLRSNDFSSCFFIFFVFFVFHSYQVFAFLLFYLPLFFMFHLHLFSPTYIFSCSTYIKLSRIVSYILVFFTWSFNGSWAGSWAFCFFIYILFEDLGYLLC